MGKLTMPKNNIEMDVFRLVLKIFYEDGGWIENETLISRLKEGYAEIRRTPETGPEGYTKKAQIPAYFGFILWEDNSRSARKIISESGKRFYEALLVDDQETIIDLLINAICYNTFGRNNSACKSDSSIEPPKVFILSSLILGGLTYAEFAYILGKLIENQANYPKALIEIRQARKNNLTLSLDADCVKFKDAKPIIFLERCGILERIGSLVCVKETICDRYESQLSSLSLFNEIEGNTQDSQEDEDEEIIDTIEQKTYNLSDISNIMKNFITALKTKPFLLLAGISGTGKSQKVKELAYMTCQKGSPLATDPTTPGNYCLIEVKPNWHDSTELLGYYSNLSGKYNITPFMHFAYKATQNPDIPFFVCLDEMNLAPVEQYFAEYLSILETRVRKDKTIDSAELIKKELFESCQTTKDGEDLYTDAELTVLNYLKENGLRLPENLFVIGTVNMDDTTHQFSRKVIDRAFTIEMNGDDLSSMFESEDPLVYPDTALHISALKPKYVKAADALNDEKIAPYKALIVKEVPARLTKINEMLEGTPFKVSFRVQNELVLYLSSLILEGNPINEDAVKSLISEATLIILLEKILPRVQGDEKLLGNSLENILKYVKDNYGSYSNRPVYIEVTNKLDQMIKRLQNTYFANFF